jgi:uncharacterized membrane protein YgdD (TMEM256/DUF423 family)
MSDTREDPARRTLIAAAVLGLLGVAAGAFGAHGLEARVGAEQLEWWQTAARYQQIHAIALLIVGFGAGDWTAWRTRAAIAFTTGILVFSGTLYAMALGGPRVLGAITPLGGLCLIAGWGLIAIEAATRKKK